MNRDRSSISKRHSKDLKEEDFSNVPLVSFRGGATSFRIPMTRENQIGERSSKGSQSFITHRPERKTTIDNLFAGKQNSLVNDDDSSEDTDSTENNQDLQLIQDVLEVC